MNEETRVHSLEELQELAVRVLSDFTHAHNGAFCIALHGDLGAGKTAFVKALAKALGVEEEVTSPTFVVMRGYELEHERFDRLIHMDAYRIESTDELDPLRFDEVASDTRTILCVEWPERVGDRLPHDALHAHIEILDGDVRSVRFRSEVVS